MISTNTNIKDEEVTTVFEALIYEIGFIGRVNKTPSYHITCVHTTTRSFFIRHENRI